MYDIAVVGAGPGGSMAALTAAKEGCRVILIEEHPEIGIPLACGEGISKEWLSKFVDIKPSWVAATIDGACFYSPSNRSFRLSYPQVGYILERKIFDRDLASLAADAGCEVRVNTRAIGLTKDGVMTNRGEIRAKIIIGADGIESKIGKCAGIDTRVNKADFWVACEYLMAGLDVMLGEVEFMTGKEVAPGGYGWVFPKGKGLANVGVGVYPLLTNKPPKFYLDKLIDWRFKKYSILSVYKSIIPSKILNSLVKDNVCLIGDAGRLVDPISGGGIGNALFSGRLAGKAAAMAIKENDISKLKIYEKEWEKEEGKNFRFKFIARDVYLKLTDADLELLFDFGAKNFGNKQMTEINELEIIKNIVTASPRFLKLGARLLKAKLFGER
ncbi:MAG: NAD(P)/FAD-dependent oxidoreductase [Candidatus Stahlbacteria bacterium]|nr:NAD(P)/FAD-dependent oxidoreductase [Candidatus Stahlbacteria bacterium]